MDNLKNIIDDIFRIENIDDIQFKRVEVNQTKIIYFIFHRNLKLINEDLTSASINPEAFILKMDGEYYYCPLNNKELDENLVKEFSKII